MSMEKIKSKHVSIHSNIILYTIAFILLALIDWTRGSQNGDVWAFAVNCTGIIMTVIMFIPHLRKEKQSSRNYIHYYIWIGIWFIGSIIGYVIWYYNPGRVFMLQYLSGAINAGCLGVIGIFLWERRYLQEGISALIKKPLTIGWIILAVLMVLSPGREIWPLWFLVMFGFFYLFPIEVEEIHSLWKGMANGIIIAFFIIQTFAYGFRPYDEVRYKGAFSNCNMNALFYLITYVMVLFRLHLIKLEKRDDNTPANKVIVKIFLFVLAGGLLSFIFFTIGRTALIVAAAITLIYGIITVLFIYKESVKKLIIQWFLLGVCAIFTFPVVYLTIRYLPGILHRPVWFEGEYHVERVHSYDPIDSEHYVSFEEFWEAAVGRLDINFILNSVSSVGRLKVYAASEEFSSEEFSEEVETKEYLLTGDDVENSMKIRREIYKLYIRDLNWRGHAITDGYYDITELYHAWHAQNFFLQMAYVYGIPAGLFSIILSLVLGFIIIRKFFADVSQTDMLVTLLIWVVFMGYGLMECVWNPGQLILFLLFFTQKAYRINGLTEKKIIRE